VHNNNERGILKKWVSAIAEVVTMFSLEKHTSLTPPYPINPPTDPPQPHTLNRVFHSLFLNSSKYIQ